MELCPIDCGRRRRPSAETRRSYRSNIFATPGYESAISGVILFDETIRQNMDDGTPIPQYLASREFILNQS